MADMLSCDDWIVEHVERAPPSDSCKQRVPSGLIRTGTLQLEGKQGDQCLLIVRHIDADVPVRAVWPRQVAGETPEKVVAAVKNFEMLVGAEERDHGDLSDADDELTRVEQARVVTVNRYQGGIASCQSAAAESLMTSLSEDKENVAPPIPGNRQTRQGGALQPKKRLEVLQGLLKSARRRQERS